MLQTVLYDIIIVRVGMEGAGVRRTIVAQVYLVHKIILGRFQQILSERKETISATVQSVQQE